jgi:hypothetical protein
MAEKKDTIITATAHIGVEKPQTLPQLLGVLTERLMTALQGDAPGPKQQTIQACLREMRIWYDAQPVEERKELAKMARKQLEQFKMVGEQFFQEMMMISAQDVQ